MKIQITILLFFILTCNLHANRSTEGTPNANTPSTTTVTEPSVEAGVAPSSNFVVDSGGGGTIADKGDLNSILGYSIIIFFSVLIIILIDNRNLEKRYKKLVSDFKNKEPLL